MITAPPTSPNRRRRGGKARRVRSSTVDELLLQTLVAVRDGDEVALLPPVSGGAPEGIDVKQELNQVVVDRCTARLNEKYVLIAHRFVDLDVNFAVWQVTGGRFTKRYSQQGGNLRREGWMGGSGENTQWMVSHRMRVN